MGKRFISAAVLAALYMCIVPCACSAEAVLLKSGKKAEGKIIKKADAYIALESKGGTTVHFLDDIEVIYNDDGTVSEYSPKQEAEKPVPPAAKERTPADTKSPISGVMVYLKSGEVISGKLLKKTDGVVTVERKGTALSFNMDEVSRIERTETKEVLPAGLRLPFSSAIIEYVYKGWQTGKETAYIDAKNNRVAIEKSTSTSFADMAVTDTQGIIYDGEVLYMIEPGENRATITKVKGDVISDIFEEPLFRNHYLKDEPYLGRQCKVYKRDGTRAYFWNGICLKEEIAGHPMGSKYNYTKEAVEIKLGVPVPQERFKVPVGIKVETMEETWSGIEDTAADLKDFAEKAGKEYQEFLLKQSKEDPELKEIIEKAGGEGGKIDFEKVSELMKAKEEKRLLEEAGAFEGGDRLIKQATKEDGTIDTYKLSSLLHEKRTEVSNKYKDLTELAEFYLKQQQYPEAIEKLTEAIRLNPESFYAYSRRADAYEIRGEYDKAIADYTAILDKKKDTNIKPYYLTRRAGLYQRLERYQEAIADYTEYLAISRERIKEDIESKKALLKKYGESEKISGAPKAEEDNVAEALKDRGDIYRKLRRYEDALRDFTEAIKLRPRDWILSDCYFLRGLTYKMMNNPARMQDDLIKAQSLGDKLVEGSYLRGEKHGHFRWYYTNGNVKTEGDYVNDKQDGKWRWYNEDGSLKTERTYKDDKPLN